MNQVLLIIMGIISLKVILDTKKGILDTDNKLNEYKPPIIVEPKIIDNKKDEDKRDHYVFSSQINNCPQKYNENMNRIFKDRILQPAGYTPNDWLNDTRYNNNKYKTPQPINI